MPSPRPLVRTVLQPLAVAVVLALVVRAALFRVYSIPSASMAPTLAVGDHIVVTPYESLLVQDEPNHGHIVVFRKPGHPDELVVKRVIATPGDLIESRGGQVLISGRALAEPYVRASASSGAIAPQIVPSGCYFVMGDNRADSFDSRHWGVLPREYVVGRARLVLWGSADVENGSSAQATTVSQSVEPRASSRVRRVFKWLD